MIYKYEEKFINFDDVSFMELYPSTFDDDQALKLKIHMKNGKVYELFAMTKYKTNEVGTTYKSEYPLEKLKKVPNAWMKWKNNQNIVVERTITKTGNTETIIEKLFYNSKEQIQSKTE